MPGHEDVPKQLSLPDPLPQSTPPDDPTELHAPLPVDLPWSLVERQAAEAEAEDVTLDAYRYALNHHINDLSTFLACIREAGSIEKAEEIYGLKD